MTEDPTRRLTGEPTRPLDRGHAGTPTPSEAPSEEILGGAPPPRERRIGPYVIQHELGRGGFGTVYRGVLKDGGFQQTAAIKVARRSIASDNDLWRFRLEQKLLSALKHESIGRFLHGGETDDGDLWIAMEFIEGQAIDLYCDRNQLSLTDRLELFLRACGAVQYAHQNFVVHRDLKPAHIVITRDRTTGDTGVKLLDFGIAKVLNTDVWGVAESTVRDAPQTPRYAAPEQILADLGTPISAATDVYALGVILFELLCGRPPYPLSTQDGSSQRQELARIMRDKIDPPPPSATTREDDAVTPSGRQTAIAEARGVKLDTLRRQLSGDLDTIVLKALEIDQHRRYQTVDELVRDIRHYLNDEPVEARPATFTYRVSKWTRRHRGWVAVTLLTAVIIGLVVGIGLALSVQSAKQRRIELVQGRLTALVEALLGDVYRDVDELSASSDAREHILAIAKSELDVLGADAPDDPSIAVLRARASNRIGEIQRDLEQDVDALASHRAALTALDAVLKEDPTNDEARRIKIETLIHIGNRYRGQGQRIEAVSAYADAMELSTDVLAENPTDFAARWIYARALVGRGKGYRLDASQPESLNAYMEARRVLGELVEEAPQDEAVALDFVKAASYLAGVHRTEGDWPTAIGYQREVVDRLTEIHASNDTFAAGYDLWAAALLLNDSLAKRDDPAEHDERVQRYREMIDLAWTLARDNPRREADALSALDLTGYRIADLHALTGDTTEALANVDWYRGLLDARWRTDRSSVTYRSYLANNDWYRARVLIQAERWEDAIIALGTAIDRAVGTDGTEEGRNVAIRIDLAAYETDLARAYAGGGRGDDACVLLREVGNRLDELEASGLRGGRAAHVSDLREAATDLQDSLACDD